MKIFYRFVFTCVFIPVSIACKGSGHELLNSDNNDDTANQNFYSLETCETSIGPDVPEFYSKYFKCVTINMSESGDYVNIYFNGLAPYESWYYPQGDANQIPYQPQGEGYFQIPGAFILEQDYVISIPVNPIMRENLTIGGYEVDGETGYPLEYPMGSVGSALNGVNMFNPCAAGDDVIEDEAFSFDLYSGHPAGQSGIYHYHTTSAGPLEVLASEGLTNSTVPGQGDIEMYGMMCDGVLVLGCTELDGMEVNGSNWDAQNGHVHDIVDENGTVHFHDRYHTHICYDELTEEDTDGNGFQEHEFTPEISYYQIPGYPFDYVCSASDQPIEPDAQLSSADDLLLIHTGLKTSYPNPFNPLITIDYTVNNFEKITLSIIDLNGNVVDVLMNKKMVPSEYTIVWDASLYPSGIYFIQYESSNFIENQKITLIK